MTGPIEPISDFELQAYVDEQLDMPQRVEVEDYLSRHPDAAARVMADLRTRDALRLAIPAPPPPHPAAQVAAARRLEHGLAMARVGRRLRWVAAAAALVAGGWFGHAQLAGSGASLETSAFVEDAVVSHRAALLRMGVRSRCTGSEYDPHEICGDAVMPHRTALLWTGTRPQPEGPEYDLDEIFAAMRIAVPPLPPDWQVLDMQVFPTAAGPGAKLAVAAGDLGMLSLFATRLKGPGATPTTAHRCGETVAYWRTGHLTYALIGTASGGRVERAAHSLAGTLRLLPDEGADRRRDREPG